jgi:diguanylate cyclase (GGDEF)-like protein
VLRRVVHLLVANVRASDVACRLGGDEFIIVMPDTRGEYALRKGKQLLDLLELPESTGIEQPRVKFSVGVAAWPRDGENVAELLQSADMALYLAKQQGGSRVVATG